jgi:phage gpG-like protein
MSAKFTVDTKQLSDKIAKGQSMLRNARPFLFSVGQREVALAKYRIRTSKTDPNNRPWRPWAPSTRVSRARRGTLTQGLLYDTGRLYQAFTVNATNLRVNIENTTQYARYLQRGTSRMPARPFLGFGRDSKQQLSRLFQDYMKRWR